MLVGLVFGRGLRELPTLTCQTAPIDIEDRVRSASVKSGRMVERSLADFKSHSAVNAVISHGFDQQQVVCGYSTTDPVAAGLAVIARSQPHESSILSRLRHTDFSGTNATADGDWSPSPFRCDGLRTGLPDAFHLMVLVCPSSVGP